MRRTGLIDVPRMTTLVSGAGQQVRKNRFEVFVRDLGFNVTEPQNYHMAELNSAARKYRLTDETAF